MRVILGKRSGFSASVDLSSLNGTNGFVMLGIHEHDRSGFSVRTAGDFNGDGVDDVIVSSPYADPSAGDSYVVFDKISVFPSSLDLSALDDINGFAIH